MMSLADLPRNDPRAALAYARESMLSGAWAVDTAEALALLQDSPERLAGDLVDLRVSLGLPAPAAPPALLVPHL